MKIIDEEYPNLKSPKELEEYVNPETCLFFDIETTGLNKASTSLYLIGCGFYNNNTLKTKFFFADSPSEEMQILYDFFDFAKNFASVIHFNGTKFDLPYLSFKAQKYNVPNPLENLTSIDIYGLIKPLRPLLFRESMRQKCVEDFMKIERKDIYNGGELINVYLDYVQSKDDELFSLLMTHNREDVLGMHKIIPILNYLKLKDVPLSYINHRINEYNDLSGNIQKEIFIDYSLDISLPVSFTSTNNGLYLKYDADSSIISIRMPLITGVMNHYYENYKDYFYLIEEKKCIHKSIALSLDKSLKQKATKENCYMEVSGTFLRQYELIFNNTCGPDYKSRNNYFLVPDSFNENEINCYGKSIITLLNSKNKKAR